MATKLIIVRHGETAWNRGNIYRGTHDVPLNDNGRHQARLTAAGLHRQAIGAAYTSPAFKSVGDGPDRSRAPQHRKRFPFIVQGNCSIDEFLVHDGDFTIETLNTTTHIVEAGVDVLDADF